MRIYKDVVKSAIPAKTVNELSHIECDLCHKVGITKYDFGHDDWDEISETRISCKEGYAYSDYGRCTTVYYDICPNCFKNKLIPLIQKTYSVAPSVGEIDW